VLARKVFGMIENEPEQVSLRHPRRERERTAAIVERILDQLNQNGRMPVTAVDPNTAGDLNLHHMLTRYALYSAHLQGVVSAANPKGVVWIGYMLADLVDGGNLMDDLAATGTAADAIRKDVGGRMDDTGHLSASAAEGDRKANLHDNSAESASRKKNQTCF